MKYAFISDLHGDVESLKIVTERFKESKDTQLIFLGDYTDGKGKHVDNKGMIEYITKIITKEIKFKVEPVFLLGNHDDFIRQCASYNSSSVFHTSGWKLNGGNSTIKALGYKWDNGITKFHFLNTEYKTYVDWLKKLPLDYETDLFYAVHAGLDMSLDNPRETSIFDKMWVRNKYYEYPNKLNKIMVTGHTPTQFLGYNGEIRKSLDEYPRYMIDGGVSSSNSTRNFPNLLLMNEDGSVTMEKVRS